MVPRLEALLGSTFETRKTSSRRPAIAVPISVSAAPDPYISAVSTWVMPRSSPRRSDAIAAAGPSSERHDPCPTAATRRPVEPKSRSVSLPAIDLPRLLESDLTGIEGVEEGGVRRVIAGQQTFRQSVGNGGVRRPHRGMSRYLCEPVSAIVITSVLGGSRFIIRVARGQRGVTEFDDRGAPAVPAPHLVFAVAECGEVAARVDQAAAASRSAQCIDRTIHRKAFGDAAQVKLQKGMWDHALRLQFKVTQSSL